MLNLNEVLEPIANFFRSLGIPEPITDWGHPAMMGTVIFVLATYVAFSGWGGRLATDKDVALKNRSTHRKLAPWMFLFLALGYTGGLLSLVMQHEPVMESPHFLTGSTILLLLALNSLISLTGFGGNKMSLRVTHAYLGSLALLLMFVHAALGLKLGLAI